MRLCVLMFIALSILFTATISSAFSETVNKENFKASFDCAHASSATEKTICTVRQLAEADVVMASIYKSLLSDLSFAEQTQLKKDQLSWLRARDHCSNEKNNIGCLKDAYKNRTEVLKKRQSTSNSETVENPTFNIDCNKVYTRPDLIYTFWENGRKIRLIIMERVVNKERLMTVYLEEDNKCKSLISDPGGYAAYFYPVKDKYPGIAIYGKKDAFGQFNQYYRWTGHTYEQIDLAESYKMNAAALALLGKEQSQKAIALWEQAAELTKIPGLNVSANPEISYHLGYAYYKKGKEYFDKADAYLKAGIKIDSTSDGERRWSANLTLGDLYSEMDKVEDAIQRYKWGINFRLSSESRSKIIAKIKKLRQLQAQNGTLPEGTISEPFEDFIADVRELSADDDYGHIVRIITDFNNDGLQDVAINIWPFGTAVPEWHLYLQDKNRKYIRVEDISFHPADIRIQPIDKNNAKIIATQYGSSQDERAIVEYLMFERDMVGLGIADGKSKYIELYSQPLQHPTSEYCIIQDYFSKNCQWISGY